MQRVGADGIASLFEPRLAAASFAFLGAYFYGLNAVLRGYVRRDLRAKTYSALTVRILIVVVLAWVLDLVWDGTTLYVLAFLTGIVPETALVLIKELARTRLQGLGASLTFGGEETDPLTKLEGIDLYDLARLFDEGVTNVQGLAHHDIVELMLQTRIPAPRILDWVDQAILYLHAGPVGGDDGAGKHTKVEAAASAVAGATSTSSDRETTLAILRRYGIRTATDLFNAYDAADSDPVGRKDRLEQLLHMLPAVSAHATPRIQAMIDVLRDEEWVVNLTHWRKSETAKPEEELKRVSELHPGTLAAAYPPPARPDPVETIDDNTVRVDGRCSIDEFNERLHTSLPENGAHTVAGFVVSTLNRQPIPGDEVAHDNYRFHVDELQDTLIGRLTVTSVPASREADAEKHQA